MKSTLFATFLAIIQLSDAKYMEGVLKTSEDWAFLARFCFLSEKGRFEYYFEFNEEQGAPNLLLYYDTDAQWPSVYKTTKTCEEKEAVLNIDQLQIINLTVSSPYLQIVAGCEYETSLPTTEIPKYTLNLPTKPPKKSTPRPSVENATRSQDKNPDSSTTSNMASSTEETTISSEDTTIWSGTTDWDVENVTFSRDKNPGAIVKRSIRGRLAYWQKKGHRTVICRNSRGFRSARERWWFIALSNCNGGRGINVKYRLWMTNGDEGDFWHEHFSADEFYILPVAMAFSIAYSFLLVGIVACTIELKSRQLLHATYKIYVFSVLFQFLGVVTTSGAYLKYSFNGIGPNALKRFGQVSMSISETMYLLLQLLLAKGYTITRGRLRIGASVKLTVFMCLYIVTYISIFIYEANAFDPGEVLYLYESPAGYGLITLRIFAWFMFIYSTIFTLKHYPEKANFYYPFNVHGTLWFIAGPAFILSANTYIDKWVRESVVCAVLQFITFGGHLTFLVLTMPSVANKNFPYHVRTSQIGVMGENGGDRTEQFSQRAYQPNDMENEQRSEPNFEEMYANEGETIRRESLVSEKDKVGRRLSWALAKNMAAVQGPPFWFNRRESMRSSFASTLSGNSDHEPDFSRKGSVNPPLPFNNHSFNDYVKDVPVELFTISKMSASGEEKSKKVDGNEIT